MHRRVLVSSVVLLLTFVLVDSLHADSLEFPGAIPGTTVVTAISGRYSVGTYSHQFTEEECIFIRCSLYTFEHDRMTMWGFLYDGEQYIDLKPVSQFGYDPDVQIHPTSVNSKGEYVGYSRLNRSAEPIQNGFSSTLGVPQDLNSLLEQVRYAFWRYGDPYPGMGVGIMGTVPLKINNESQVYGTVICLYEGCVGEFLLDGANVYANYGSHTEFVELPSGIYRAIPEPNSIAVLVLSLLAFGSCRLLHRTKNKSGLRSFS
ncbi:MAG TPA: hypothetical protein VN577_11175 [Terriglobales bacterium]|nr:hypothetical protein [Terriglobales bacterium]